MPIRRLETTSDQHLATSNQKWLHWFACLVTAATLGLIYLGALVTSKGAGLAVPDWPLSFGSLNPPGWWSIDNVRIEHSHRLVAATIGFLTGVLAIWIWQKDGRTWVKRVGWFAFLLVCAQGLLGGLRVTLISTEFAIIHGCVAHVFFCTLILLAMATSPHWDRFHNALTDRNNPGFKIISLALVMAVFLQLILGAWTRHLGAGLAIPDFPLAMGRLLPPLSSPEITIHFVHRLGALVVSVLMIWNFFISFSQWRREKHLMIPLSVLIGLLLVQISLGASVIWFERPPVPTSAHVVVGALILGISFLVMVRGRQLIRPHLSPLPEGEGGG